MPTLSYDDAVEEALCFGWIDSLIKKRDDDSFVRKLTPRKSDSLWSDANKARVAKLTQDGLMASPGKKKVAEAKRLGVWEKSSRPDIELEMPIEFSKALAKNKTAKEFFDLLAPSYQRQFIGWIASAKRSQTKQRRVEESINLLESGQRLGR